MLDCELNGDKYEEPKKHNYSFCADCNLEMLIDYQKSISVCTNCGLCEYYQVYVSYNLESNPNCGRLDFVRCAVFSKGF